MKALRLLALLVCLLASTITPPARTDGIIREVTARRLSQMGEERQLKTLEQMRLKVVKYTTLPIELLKEGDWVLTRDEHDAEGGPGLTQIEEKFERIAYHLRHLTLHSSNGHTQTIPTTNEHPAYVEELGIWVKAADVEVGQSLNELPGGTSAVTETFQERQH